MRVRLPATGRGVTRGSGKGLGEWVETPKGRRAKSWVGFHTFRHTCATMLITEEKWSLEQVQVYLGHADYATTRKYYVHLVPKDLPCADLRPHPGGWQQGGNRTCGDEPRRRICGQRENRVMNRVFADQRRRREMPVSIS